MTNTNATALRKNLFSLLANTIKYNEPIHVNTKDGNAVILSEEDYNGMLATLELCESSELKAKILAGKKEDPGDCVDIDEVKW